MLQAFDTRVLEDFRAGFHRGAAESRDIARGIQSRTHFIGHAAVINVRPDFRTQLTSLYDAQLMIKFARNHLRLAAVVVEMLLLAGHFQVAATREVAVNSLVTNNLLHTIDGFEGRGVHALSEFASIDRDELVHAQLHAGQHHATVAGAGSPADGFAFEHNDSRAAFRKGAGRRESRKPGADDNDIHPVREWTNFRRRKCRGREPVVVFLQGHVCLQRTAVSWISRPSAKRARFSNDASISSVSPLRIRSLRIFPVAGACITPCPLKPFARKKPGAPGASPRIGWWSGVISYRPAHARLGFTGILAKQGTRSAARVRIFSTKAASKSVLNPGVSSGSFQARRKPRASGRKGNPFDMSTIMGAVWGNSSKGSLGTNIRRNAVPAKSSTAS